MKWSKPVSDNIKTISDNWENAFYKTGFVNEKIFKNPERDVAKHFIKAMEQISSEAFDYILVAWKEIPADAASIKKIELEKFYAKVNTTKKSVSTGVSVSPDVKNYKIYRVLYIVNPTKVSEERRYFGIQNTKKAIENGILDGYTHINEDAIKFINEFKFDNLDYSTKKDVNTAHELFIEPKDYLIPVLKYDMYYELDGVKRYPQYTEDYYYARNNSDELTFLYKHSIPGSLSNSYEGYFGLGKINGANIHYIRHSGRTYNIFSIFKPYMAKNVFNILMKSDDRTLRKIIRNTYIDYEKYLKDYEDHTYIYPRILDGESINDRSTKKIMSIPISSATVIRLVESYYNDKFRVNLYGSVESALLKTNAIGGNKSARNDKQTGALLRGEQIVVSVKSNPLLTVANQNSNPIDVFLLASYRRALSGKTAAENVKTNDRFIDEDTYHLKDPVSSRSEKSVGIASNLILHLDDSHITSDENGGSNDN